MFLTELFEAVDKRHAAFCFGRMNPPTVGHGQLINTVARSAAGGDYFIFTSQTQDPKKNPLDYATKVKFLKALFPDHTSHIVQDPSLKTIMQVAHWLYSKGYRKITFVAGSDRLADFQELLEKYNGVETKNGYYKFDSINFASSGDRDPDAEGVTGVSASAARAAAAAGNYEAFAQAVSAGKLTKGLYDAVRKGMNLSEGHPNQQISLYNPDGTTYRQEKMPGFSPDDIYSRRPSVEVGPEHEYAMDINTEPEELGQQDSLRRLIKKNLDKLESREKQIMYLRFYKDQTLEQIAKQFNIGVERIRQIEAKALRKLRFHMKDIEIAEDASGYIPKNKKEARDSRWSNALTVDVHPNTPTKNLKAFRLI